MFGVRFASTWSRVMRIIVSFCVGFSFAISILGKANALGAETAGTAEDPNRFERVRSIILETIESTGVASVAVAVAKDGEIIWEEGFGWANREKGIEATPQTVYHLASISKPITATGLMLLVERGLVDLDKPANDYLGTSKLSAFVGRPDDATVRRIVFHTAGLPMHWNFFRADGSDERPSMDESIRRYGILVTAPGETYNYSNFGYGILGYIISRISGKDYPDFMREEVFEPLGLTRMWVQVDARATDDVAQMYDESQKPIEPYDFDHRGASAVLSSVHDLVRFGMFHLGNRLPDQKPILESETIESVHKEIGSNFHDEGGITVDYLLSSFGGVDLGGYRFVVASGSMPGAASRLAMVPSENVATALVSNGDNIDLWQIEKAIFQIMLSKFTGETAVDEESVSDEPAMERVPPGSFLGSWSGKIVTYAGEIPVEVDFPQDGRVSVEIRGSALLPLEIRTPLGEMGFKDSVFKGLFMGQIDTPDAARSPHIVLVKCGLRGDRMIGTASAVAMNKYFCLPYYLELSRVQ